MEGFYQFLYIPGIKTFAKNPEKESKRLAVRGARCAGRLRRGAPAAWGACRGGACRRGACRGGMGFLHEMRSAVELKMVFLFGFWVLLKIKNIGLDGCNCI